MSDDYSPRFVGDTRPFPVTFTYHDGSVYSLVGVASTAITLKMRSRTSGAVTSGTGVWTIVNGSEGTANYQPSSADVSTADLFDIEVIVAGTPFDFKPLELIAPF